VLIWVPGVGENPRSKPLPKRKKSGGKGEYPQVMEKGFSLNCEDGKGLAKKDGGKRGRPGRGQKRF